MKDKSNNIDSIVLQIKKSRTKESHPTILHFLQKLKSINRNMVYQLRDAKYIDTLSIDGVEFVIMNQKAKTYQKTK